MSLKVIHLTHTDLRYDNRILKELETIGNNTNYTVKAIGVYMDESVAYSNRFIKADIKNITSFTNKLYGLPRGFVYSFMLIELSFKLLFHAVRFKPNVIHCHDTMVLPAGVLLKIFFRGILIYDAHELESAKNGQSRILSMATLLIEKLSWNKVDIFISVSNSIITWYNEKFIPKPSVLILNSPIFDQKSYRNSDKYPEDYLRKKFNIPAQSLIFVYVGLLGKGRSIDTLISVFSDDTINSHIVFVGYGDLQQDIYNISTVVDKIHFHSAVPQEDVVSLIRDANIGLCLIENVSLSDYFSLPNKLFEYIFAGLKVLASDCPEIKSIIMSYKLGWCSDVQFNTLMSTISSLEQDTGGEIALNIEDLSWEAQAMRLTDLYNDLALKKI